MAELMREDADSAVFRLDSIVADPVVRIANARAAEIVRAGAVGAIRAVPRIPAMAPDGVGALRAATRLLTSASVDRLEMVDVTVRL